MRINRKIIVVTLAVLLGVMALAPLAGADDVRVTTAFDRRSVNVNEEINMTITVKGANTSVIRPRIPAMQAFESYYSGRSSHFTFVNGVSESTTAFSYVLVPKVPGKFKVPPIEVDVGGQIFRSAPVEIEVLGQAPAAPSPGPTKPAPTPRSVSPVALPQAPPPTTRDPNIFLEVTTDKQEVYSNQQVLLTFNLYTRYDTRYEGFEEEPETSGFWVEEFPLGRELDKSIVQVGGRRYIRATVRKLALFPTAAGKYEISPGVIRASVREQQTSRSVFDDFFEDSFFSSGGFFARREEKRLTSPKITINAIPLPEKGRPEDFSGLVGNFNIRASLDKRTVKQNEPITLTIVIEGDGNIETLERPEIPEIPNCKIYDSDRSSQLFQSRDLIRGRKTFEVILVPSEAGNFTIPALIFNFFNPLTKRYIKQKTSFFTVKVTPGPPAPKAAEFYQARRAPKKGLKVEARDIYFIKEKLPKHSLFKTEFFLLRLASGTAVLGTILWIVLFAVKLRESALDKDIALKRRILAPRKFRKSLRQIRRWHKSDKEKDQRLFFENVRHTLDQYFSDKFNLSPQGLTRAAIEERLHNIGISEELIGKIHWLYEQCDLIHFTREHFTKETLGKAWRILTRAIHDVEKKR